MVHKRKLERYIIRTDILVNSDSPEEVRKLGDKVFERVSPMMEEVGVTKHIAVANIQTKHRKLEI